MLQATVLNDNPLRASFPRYINDLAQRNVRSVTSGRNVTYTGRLALDESVRQDAYKLRYRSYRASGYIDKNELKLFSDRYDSMASVSTVVIYEGDFAVASVRTCLLARDTSLTSPALEAFPEEVRQILGKDVDNAFAGRGIEVTRLVRAPEAENNQGLVFLLYRIAGYIAMRTHSQIHLACVRANHAPFYRRLGYSAASEPRSYPGLKCPMLLMASDREQFDRVRAAVPLIDPLNGATKNLQGFFAGEPILLNLKS